MILASILDLKFLIRTWGPRAKNFKSAALAVPRNRGSALHHLVTSGSVKKALTVRGGIGEVLDSSTLAGGAKRPSTAAVRQVMRSAHTRSKCTATTGYRLLGRRHGGTVHFENLLLPFSCPV